MTQEFALSFFVALVLISLFALGTFEKILNYVMFIDSLSLVSAAGTIFILRRRAQEKPEAVFSLKLFPFVPILFMLVLLVVTINVALADSLAALYGTIIFLAGLPLFWVLKVLLSTTEMSSKKE
jgi:APA family basic amino acid/polyamine antiporter